MDGTAIIKCSCKHEFQDKQYGAGNRVHNYARSANREGGWRCTVCQVVKPKSASGNDKS